MPDDAVRFGDGFELDRAAYELRRRGGPLRLERIPMEILLLLVESRGQLVTRDEIIARVWGNDVFLDTDTSINSAIRKIRQALKDNPEDPAFIQTVTGKGYRFIATVEIIGEPPSSIATSVPVSSAFPTPPSTQIAEKTPEALDSPADVPLQIPQAPSQTAALIAPIERPAKEVSRTRSWVVWSLAGVAVLIVAAAAVWFLRPEPAQLSMPVPVPLTTYRGSQNFPSFSPGGDQVAFQWDGEKQDNLDIYVKGLGPDAVPLRLTTNPAPDLWPAWSPDGTTIAFVRFVALDKADLMLIPALGGPERKLAEFPCWPYMLLPLPAWSPDSKWLVLPAALEQDHVGLFRVSVETGESMQITRPDPSFEDITPTFSPDGGTLMFLRRPAYSWGFLYEVHVDRNATPTDLPRQVPSGGLLVGRPNWLASGKQLLLRTPTGAIQMPIAGSDHPEPVPWLGSKGDLDWVDVSRRGDRMAYSLMRGDSNIWQIDLAAKVPHPERLIASTASDSDPQYSPSGQKLAFYSDRSGGGGQLWVGDPQGRQARQLTFVKRRATTPRWSPDGRTLAFDSTDSGLAQIYTVGADGGKMTQLTEGPSANSGATWSRDGRSMYFSSTRTGRSEVWKMPEGGGGAVQVTHNGGLTGIESFDGKTLYFGKEPGPGSIWEMPVTGGPEVQIADSLYRDNFAVTKKGIYYMTSAGYARTSTLKFYNFATKATETILPMGVPEYGLDVSPDGRYLVYSQLDDPASNLMLLENFH